MEKNILRLLDKLISFKSVSSNKRESDKVIDFVVKYLSHKTLKFEKFIDNGFSSLIVYGKNHVANKPFRILLNAHLDVVPAPDKIFKMRKSGDKIFGRGVFDMKGAGAVMIE